MVNYIFFILFTYLLAGRLAGYGQIVSSQHMLRDLQRPVLITPDRLSIKPMDTPANNTIAD
jgi:hypothetical protein